MERTFCVKQINLGVIFKNRFRYFMHNIRNDSVQAVSQKPRLLNGYEFLFSILYFVVKCKPQQNQEKLPGLIENNPKKGLDNPTNERLIKAFDQINLTIVHLPDRSLRYVTTLTDLQCRILELLGLSPASYTRLAEN